MKYQAAWDRQQSHVCANSTNPQPPPPPPILYISISEAIQFINACFYDLIVLITTYVYIYHQLFLNTDKSYLPLGSFLWITGPIENYTYHSPRGINYAFAMSYFIKSLLYIGGTSTTKCTLNERTVSLCFVMLGLHYFSPWIQGLSESLQGCFTGTGTILWLPLWQWSNPE